jgi:hypothetical protein
MLSKNIVTKLVAGAVIAFAAVAARAGDNPLQPDYFQAKTAVSGVASAGERYVDAHNPLTPSFYAKGGWEAVAASVAYADSRNPTHPMHRKF